MKRGKSDTKLDKLDRFVSLSRQKSVQILLAVAVIYMLLVTLEIPFVFDSGPTSETTTTTTTTPTLAGFSELQSEQVLQDKDAPTRPLNWVSHNFSRPTQSQLAASKILSSLGFHPKTLDPTKKDGSVDLHKAAKTAWEEGIKLWDEVQSGKVKLLEVSNLKNISEPCPISVTLSGSDFLKRSKLLELPCGLTLGSHITLVGKPRAAHAEKDPKIALVKEADDEVMVSQFIMELLGLKTVEAEDPPKILHFNPRLKGDWSLKPVIEQNTCYRMQWGTALRCEGWGSEVDEETVDDQVQCEKWIRDDDDISEESKATLWLNRRIETRLFRLLSLGFIEKMATKKSVSSLKETDLKGKRVFVRVDLNVPLDDNFNITDDTRIRAAVPTIKYLMDHGARVILCSHLGRPKGVTPKYSLKPLVPRLSELLGVEVKIANDCIGEEVEKLVAGIPGGGALLLENVRFHKEEEKNDPEFAKKLASLAEVYVNDAFGTAHRAHASTEGVAKYLKPAVAGFLMQKELDYLVGAVANPKKPFAAIVGGSKVSSKIGVIESLLEKVDFLFLGGGMIYTFYKAQGYSIGSSLVEEDKLDLATSLIEKAKVKGVKLLLPADVVVADKFAPDANSKVVPASEIADGWMGLDIGPDSIKTFSEALDTTKTIIWNGPMGVFEFEKFAAGTEAIAWKLAELSGKGVTTIIGGGDSVAAVEKAGLADKMSHISTGGGASLELLEGKPLPGVLALDDA